MMSTYFLYITTSDESEAERIGRRLVEEKLVACVNILPEAKSIYRWEGKIEENNESVIIGKTSSDLVDKVKERVCELHSYDCPCVVAIEIDKGNDEFINWINSSVE